MYQIDDEITIEPIELVAGGDALARVDGFPIFVRAIYPGDRARVRLTEVKKGFARGELIELLRPSGDRRAEPCPVAEECGGCDWTALRLDRQLEAKRRILSESLRRIGKFDPRALPPVTIHPSPLNYRLRSRLHREGDAIGFYALRSNRVVPLPGECEVVGLATREHPLEGESWEVDGRVVTEGEMNVDGYTVGTGTFFQVNRHLLGTMRRLVTAIAERTKSRSTALDLYAGAGFFTRPLAAMFEHVTAVEGSRVSAKYARRNVPPNVEIVNASVEDWVDPWRTHSPSAAADFLLLDPPRAGTRKTVIDAISKNTREIVCYLSCDPVTFARDASRLTASGWRLSTLDLLDLFPNTHHVETLSSFERAASPP